MQVSRAPSLYQPLRDIMSILRPLLCASLCALAPSAVAQTVTSAATVNYRITGIVTAFGGNPVEKAEITLLRDGANRQSAFSGVDGRFTLGELSAGKANLQVRRLGYEQRNMNINVGDEAKPTYVEILL